MLGKRLASCRLFAIDPPPVPHPVGVPPHPAHGMGRVCQHCVCQQLAQLGQGCLQGLSWQQAHPPEPAWLVCRPGAPSHPWLRQQGADGAPLLHIPRQEAQQQLGVARQQAAELVEARRQLADAQQAAGGAEAQASALAAAQAAQQELEAERQALQQRLTAAEEQLSAGREVAEAEAAAASEQQDRQAALVAELAAVQQQLQEERQRVGALQVSVQVSWQCRNQHWDSSLQQWLGRDVMGFGGQQG